jgi:hypothetical protein
MTRFMFSATATSELTATRNSSVVTTDASLECDTVREGRLVLFPVLLGVDKGLTSESETCSVAWYSANKRGG